ncbi:VOC family protein [Nesterenkonia massiliensis]|uniref:VOC family protein n=1 Tax=Nesterenkonia massiliensis TaxID=1232429 RepID=A0ABT2HS79_9MICC|nr:VOC family protein [Nesterenkonia massiliensis]MCT1607369.1 VOC family protein [Nesterenkonia massiliensis]
MSISGPSSSPSHITFGAWNVQAEDPDRLATFWAEFLQVAPQLSIDSAYLPAAGAGGVPMMFQLRSDPRPQYQVAHLDLTVPWDRRETEVRRALRLGALHEWDVLDEYPHVQWSTLSDPEGNLFCLAEHPPVQPKQR